MTVITLMEYLRYPKMLQTNLFLVVFPDKGDGSELTHIITSFSCAESSGNHW